MFLRRSLCMPRMTLTMSSALNVHSNYPTHSFVLCRSRRPCPPLLLPLSPRHHSRSCSIIPQPQMRPTSQAQRTLRGLAEYTQADTAHKANIHHLPMAEACSAKIHTRLRGCNEMCARSSIREEREEESGEDAVCGGWLDGVSLLLFF